MTASAGAWYRVGTVNVTKNNAAVTGVGSSWQNDVIAIAIGDFFTLDAKTWYEVIAVNSDTSITLDRGFEGASGAGQSYAIARNTSGTILTRIAGQISVQFNQKQLFLDELRNWLTSTDSSVSLTDSHGNTYQYKSLKNIQAITGTAANRDVGESSGNLMEVGAGGLLGYTNDHSVIPPDADLNDVKITGFYSVDSTVLNIPLAIHFTLQVIGRAETYTTQILFSDDVSYDSRTFVRKQIRGGWSSWRELYHTGNILGTVSQSGGVPTGAIIESGSNANGRYVKYADGTLICTRRFLPASSTAWQTAAYPSSFASDPEVSGAFSESTYGSGYDDAAIGFYLGRITSGWVVRWLGGGSTGTTNFGLTAIGRWF